MNRKCNAFYITAHGDALLRLSPVPYLRGCPLKMANGHTQCITNTRFDVDHTAVLQLLDEDRHWAALGSPLGNEEEFLAALNPFVRRRARG